MGTNAFIAVFVIEVFDFIILLSNQKKGGGYMSQGYTLNSAIDHHRLKWHQLSKTLFEKWFNENKLDDDYFTRHEMYWFAEQAWIAATIILQNTEEKINEININEK